MAQRWAERVGPIQSRVWPDPKQPRPEQSMAALNLLACRTRRRRKVNTSSAKVHRRSPSKPPRCFPCTAPISANASSRLRWSLRISGSGPPRAKIQTARLLSAYFGLKISVWANHLSLEITRQAISRISSGFNNSGDGLVALRIEPVA